MMIIRKTMQQIVYTALAVGVFVLTATTASATLTGDEIRGTLTFGQSTNNAFHPSSIFFPDSARQTDGGTNIALSIVEDPDVEVPEFQFLQVSSATLEVDVDGSSIWVSQIPLENTFPTNSWNIWLEDLDWVGQQGRIVDVLIVDSTFPAGLTVDFTDDSVHIANPQSQIPFPEGWEAHLQLVTTHTVPEPITTTLGLMGLGVLDMTTRRRAT